MPLFFWEVEGESKGRKMMSFGGDLLYLFDTRLEGI